MSVSGVVVVVVVVAAAAAAAVAVVVLLLVTFGRLAVSDFELGMNVIVYLFTVLYCI